MENERADAGPDGRTRHARPNSQARTGIGKSKQTVKRTASRIVNRTRLIHTLLKGLTIHIMCVDITGGYRK